MSSATALTFGTKKFTNIMTFSTSSLKTPSSSSLNSSRFTIRRKNLKDVQCNYCSLYGHVIRDCQKRWYYEQHKSSYIVAITPEAESQFSKAPDHQIFVSYGHFTIILSALQLMEILRGQFGKHGWR